MQLLITRITLIHTFTRLTAYNLIPTQLTHLPIKNPPLNTYTLPTHRIRTEIALILTRQALILILTSKAVHNRFRTL